MSNLIRLVYTSRARFEAQPPAQGIEPTVARILMQSRRNNPRQQIGGVLYYGNGYFFQCLEGMSAAVNQLVSRIMQDERHDHIEIVKVTPVRERLFNNWSMKFVPLEKDVQALLREFGHERFTPGVLQDELIDRLVQLFASAQRTDSAPDQDYTYPPSAAPSLWSRLLRRLGLDR